MKISYMQDHKIKEKFEATGIIRKLKQKKHVQSLLVREDAFRGIRIFLREEVGLIERVAWLGIEDATGFANSTFETYYNYSTRMGINENIQKVSKNKKSSKIQNNSRKKPSTPKLRSKSR